VFLGEPPPIRRGSNVVALRQPAVKRVRVERKRGPRNGVATRKR
jgi:hypothetical protein